MEEIIGQGTVGKGAELLCHLPSTSMCSPTWKLSKPFCLRFLQRFCYIDINHWPLLIELNVQSLYSPWRSGSSALKFQPSNALPHPQVGSLGNQPPSDLPSPCP